MNAQSSPQINFLEIQDNFVLYAIGSNVYQIEVTAEDLEEVFGVESREWESPIGKSYSDNYATIPNLSEVHESDYTLLITTLMAKAEDVTDSYEGPVTVFEKSLFCIAQLSNQPIVRDQLLALMIDSRRH